MKYEDIHQGEFLSRPNRFIATVRINGQEETVHVKNTGRCKELLTDHAEVYLEKSKNPERSTAYDLVVVRKNGQLINMDSYAPNIAAGEWLSKGSLFKNPVLIKPETTYGDSRFDFYIETRDDRKIFLEVKGVTLENDGIVSFPDAPSERAVKHVYELIKAKQAGYEAYLLFVVQMEKAAYLIPNVTTQPEFAKALLEARAAGVEILAYDCRVTIDTMELRCQIPVYLSPLDRIADPLLAWYDKGHRILPWREEPTPYHVWVSEIMLQQTRVEAVKPYYDRFLKELPNIESLANAEEERLLKLWEGLGYYNRVRNLQKAARIIMEEYQGEMPADFGELLKLPGIGSYTAGAVSSIAYQRKVPAVDGNVLRVTSRVCADTRDILDAKVKKALEQDMMYAISNQRPGDFNQAMMELGAMVCAPNGAPHCESCPLQQICQAHLKGIEMEFPVKTKRKARTIEEKTVLVIQDDNKAALVKRPSKGLLAGMYEFPCLPGIQNEKQVLKYLEQIGLNPIRIQKLERAKHIFTHKEWHMNGFSVKVDELEPVKKGKAQLDYVFVEKTQIEEQYPIPSAYVTYAKFLNITQGADVFQN